MTTPNAHLKVEFSPAWQFINDVRRFVEEFCTHAGVAPERAEAAGTATHELLQNAVRYSVDGRASLTVDIDGAQEELRITAENDALPDKVEALVKLRDRMAEERDSRNFYLTLMKETVGKDGSGLGLGRIRYECDMRLAIDIEGTKVTVSAHGPLTADSGGHPLY